MNEAVSVVHEAEAARFVYESEPERGLLQYRLEGDTMIIDRTYVPSSLRGKGVAARLVEAALAHATAAKLSVVPECSYVEGYLKRRDAPA